MTSLLLLWLLAAGTPRDGLIAPRPDGRADLVLWSDDPTADELGWQTVVGGEPVRIESRPLSLLITVAAGGPAVVRRELAVPVDPYVALVVTVRPEPGTRVAVAVDVDGETSPAMAIDRAGRARLPLAGRTLEGLRVELAGEGSRGHLGFDLLDLTLLPRERLIGRARVFANRGVYLSWDRPEWGAERYFVTRDRQPVARTSEGTAIAAGRAAATPWLWDCPPAGGRWHYRVAPIEPGGLGPPLLLEVEVTETPVPRLAYAETEPRIDGDLTDWPAGEGLRIDASGGVVGEPPAAAADLSAVARLAHDQRFLYLAVEVTDDVVAHRHRHAWQGDGVVLLLGNAEAEIGWRLVVCYTAGDEPDGRLLQDAEQVFDPENKPLAPGSRACRRTATGYVIEARLPLDFLRRCGLAVDGRWLALGLTLHDADQPTGETTRQTALGWPVRRELYDAREAGLVELERYP